MQNLLLLQLLLLPFFSFAQKIDIKLNPYGPLHFQKQFSFIENSGVILSQNIEIQNFDRSFYNSLTILNCEQFLNQRSNTGFLDVKNTNTLKVNEDYILDYNYRIRKMKEDVIVDLSGLSNLTNPH